MLDLEPGIYWVTASYLDFNSPNHVPVYSGPYEGTHYAGTRVTVSVATTVELVLDLEANP